MDIEDLKEIGEQLEIISNSMIKVSMNLLTEYDKAADQLEFLSSHCRRIAEKIRTNNGN